MSDTKQFLDKDGLDALWGKMCEIFPHKNALGNYLPLAGGKMSGTITSQNIIPAIAHTSTDTGTVTGYSLGSSSKQFNTTYTRYVDTMSGYNLRLKAGGTEHLNMYGGNVTSSANIIPNKTTGNYNLGATDKKWSNVYANTFNGHLEGTIKMVAGTANDYRDILVTNGSNGICYSSAHNVQLNYATGDVKATSFTGNLKGTANIAKTLPYFKIESNGELPKDKLPEYVKFATITIPATSWARRSVTLFFQDHESLGYQGDILTIQVSSDGNGVGIMPNVKWVTKYKKSTIGNIVISKISSNVYDLYLEATTLSYITLRIFYLTINDVGEGKTFYFIDNANTWSTTAPVITARSTLNNVASSLANAKTIWGQSFDGTDNVSGDMTNVGSISMSKALTITGTDASTANLHFGRESYNYISGPSGSTIHMCPGGIAKDSTHGYIFGSTEFYPGTTNAYSIGTDTKKWKNVYATTFTGSLTGNASSASKLSSTKTTFTPANTALTPDQVYALVGGTTIRRGTWSYADNGYISNDTTGVGTIDLAGTTVIQADGGSSTAYTQLYLTPSTGNTTGYKPNEIFMYNNNGSSYNPSWTRVLTNRNYTDYALPITGGIMTGPITFNCSDEVDRNIIRINGGNYTDSTIGKWGFTLKYLGSGSGDDNSLALYADNQQAETQNTAFEIKQSGNIHFGNSVYATTFTGNLTGNASSAGTIKIYNSNNAGNYPLTFVSTTNEENQALYVSPTNQLTFQPSTGTLKAKTFTGTNASLTGPLTITGTANSTVASINFSRGSETDTTWNYITAPLGGNIVIAPNGVDKSSTKGYHFGGTSLYPGVNSTNVDTGYNLGNDTHKWKDAYIRTIHANNLTFIGTAHPHIGGNGESLSLGYSPTISSQMVFVEGAIRRNTSNTSTTLGTSQYPWPTIFSDITKTKSIAFQGDDTDRILMRVAAGNTDPDAIGNYGYTLKYLGSGTGINNALALYVDNEKGAEQLLGTKWTNDGKMYSRSILPHTNDAYNLGATDKQWNNVYAKTFTGDLSGDAATATAMSSFSAVSSSTTKRYVWMSYNDNSGKPAYSDKLTFQTSTNTLFSTNFSGNLTGDVTGDITGNAGSASNIYINTSSTNSYYPMTFVTTTGAGNKSLYIDSSTNTASDSSGIRYNPSSNACYCSGGFYEASDERLKNFGDDIEVDLDKLSQLSKKYFTWKDDKSNVQQIGISAQELQKLYPELVNVIDEEGHLSVSYDKLSVIALKGIDVLNDKVKSLEERFERLEKLIKE